MTNAMTARPDLRLSRDWRDGYRLSVETLTRRGIDAWQRFRPRYPVGRIWTRAEHDAVIRDFIAREGLAAEGGEE